MTIYALVNNIVSGETREIVDAPIWTVISASSMLQGGNPYFVPDFDSTFEAHPAFAIRIGKLGKSISPRFAHRYIDGIAPASMMIAKNLLGQLQRCGLPWAQAISYDRSVAIGKFESIIMEELSQSQVSLTLTEGHSTAVQEQHAERLRQTIEDTIEAISRDNALKTGDIILTGITDTGLQLQPGQRLTMTLNGKESMRFNIR